MKITGLTFLVIQKFNEALRVVYFGENAKTLLVKSLSRSKLPITLAS